MSIGANISDKFELPKDLLLGAMNIHMTGKYEAYIENYKSIKEYDGTKIVINGKRNCVSICGTNLKIEYFTKTDMKIKGIISEVLFDI